MAYRNIRREVAWTRLVLVALATIMLSMGCEQDEPISLSKLAGVWKTDARRYADRVFEIREDAIVFGTGEFGAPEYHAVVSVDVVPSPSGGQAESERWRVEYREDDGAIGEIEMSYRSQPTPSLQFVNRSEVWTRIEAKQ